MKDNCLICKKNEKIVKDGLCVKCYPIKALKQQHPNFNQNSLIVHVRKAFGTYVFVFANDTQNKKFAIYYAKGDYTQIKFEIYDYRDLVDFDVTEDGNSVTQGKGGSAFIGALLLGVPGAIIGAAGSQTTKQQCNAIRLHLRTKNHSRDDTFYFFLDKVTPIPVNSMEYTTASQALKKVTYELSTILKSNDPSTKETSSSADEIRKYKELLNDGIITQEEFEAKKEQLLGL